MKLTHRIGRAAGPLFAVGLLMACALAVVLAAAGDPTP